MNMRKKCLSSFELADEYDSNFDVDVFSENEIAFFVNKNKTNSYFIKAQVSDTEEDSIDYTIYRKNSKDMYEEWDGGFIECKRNTCLQVVDLLSFSGISSEELKDILPEDIEFVDTKYNETFNSFNVLIFNF